MTKQCCTPMGGLPLLRQGEHLSLTRQAYVAAGYSFIASINGVPFMGHRQTE